MASGENDHASRNAVVGRIARMIWFWLRYSLYLVLVFLTIDYIFFHRPRIKKLKATAVPSADRPTASGDFEGVSPDLLKLVGWLPPSRGSAKKSYFVHFPPKKTKRARRICCLGDSFTWGSEVGKEHDFPSFLQEMIDEQSSLDAEVLNFGVPNFGFHQSFIMWDRLARKMDCDTLLLGPGAFSSRRDLTFNHNLYSPYHLHARYIIDSGDLKLIEVVGDTFDDRFGRYFSFFQPLRYLRYDKNTPTFIQALLPSSRELENPFYYHQGPGESRAIYQAMLSTMAEHSDLVVFLHTNPQYVLDARSLGLKNLKAATFYRPREFPYSAPMGHASAWGNQVLARQYLGQLLGQSNMEIVALQTFDLPDSGQESQPAAQKALWRYRSVSLEINGQVAGAFLPVSGKGDDAIKTKKVASFLGIKDPDDSIMDAYLLPLDRHLGKSSKLTLRVGSESRQLGGVSSIAGGILSFVNLEGVEIDFSRRKLVLSIARSRTGRFLNRGGKIGVFLEDQQILQGWRQGGKVIFRPIRGGFFHIRVRAKDVVDFHQLEASGTIDLAISDSGAGRFKRPLAGWRKTLLEVSRGKVVSASPLEENDEHLAAAVGR